MVYCGWSHFNGTCDKQSWFFPWWHSLLFIVAFYFFQTVEWVNCVSNNNQTGHNSSPSFIHWKRKAYPGRTSQYFRLRSGSLWGVTWFSAMDRLVWMINQGRCNIHPVHGTPCRWPAHGRWRWRSLGAGQYLHLFQKVSSGPLICSSIDKQARTNRLGQLMTTAESMSHW